MKSLTISWQRLVDSGKTCPRCGDTGHEVRQATANLAAALAPLGITVNFKERVIPLAEFKRAPLESNQIFINGRLVEDWLGGETGQSPCCEVCGPNECRTVTVNGTSYESVPADLVVRAGLRAANAFLAAPAPETAACCGTTVLPVDIPVGQPDATDAVPAGVGCCGVASAR